MKANQKLLKALSHPLRVEILNILNERMASPNELAKELGEGLSQVSYHVKVLKDFECVEMVKTEPRRGAVEHYYRAKVQAVVPKWEVAKLPRSAQHALASGELSEIEADLVTSVRENTFYRSRKLVVRRSLMELDGQGCEGAEELVEEFLERYAKLGVESRRRARKGESDGDLRQVSAVALVFDSASEQRPKGKQR